MASDWQSACCQPIRWHICKFLSWIFNMKSRPQVLTQSSINKLLSHSVSGWIPQFNDSVSQMKITITWLNQGISSLWWIENKINKCVNMTYLNRRAIENNLPCGTGSRLTKNCSDWLMLSCDLLNWCTFIWCLYKVYQSKISSPWNK